LYAIDLSSSARAQKVFTQKVFTHILIRLGHVLRWVTACEQVNHLGMQPDA